MATDIGNSNKLRKDDINEFYQVEAKLGTGSFAVVQQATRKSDGKQFAVKIIKKSKLNADELAVVLDEVVVLHHVDHPNCVKLFEVFETSSELHLVLELLTGGELFDRIVAKGSYSEKEAALVIRDIAGAIKYLHSVGVVHRDLKPENLLYLNSTPDSPIKVTDFGLAKLKGTFDSTTTACCVAPEVLENGSYGGEVDWWSLGVILFTLLYGFPPFFNEDVPNLFKQLKEGRYDLPEPYFSDISDEAKHLVASLLTLDPKKRMTADGVLQHPWITGQAPDKAFASSHNERLKQLQARHRLLQMNPSSSTSSVRPDEKGNDSDAN